MADYYGGRSMYSNTDECYDVGKHGHGGRRMYSHTDEYRGGYGGEMQQYADNGYDGGYGARQTAVYSDEYSRGGEQQYYKREEKQHKQHERLGEVGALAGGAFALYEGHRAKTDPAHKQKHMVEAGVAGAAALGAGGYAYHEHRKQEEARYEGDQHRVPHGYCN